MVGGGILSVIGAFADIKVFAFSYLQAFIFCLSFVLGGLFLTILHHLFDASWSVPIRRTTETLANLSKWMIVLWIPLGILGPKYIYKWIQLLSSNPEYHPLHAKHPMMTLPGYYIVSAICLLTWYWLSNRLSYWSLKQDETGSFECTKKMRFYSCLGVVLFAITLTFGIIMWVKSLQVEWFSTMFGVWYFAANNWVTMATVYLIVLMLKRQGPLQGIAKDKTFYFMGTLMFAFTVFWAYISFAQYFIIWNANMPEETFFYVVREQGSWFWLSVLLIFGHFFIPFLALLRIDLKHKIWWMGPIIVWVWIMHFCDISFNIMPVLRPDNFVLHWIDLGVLACMVGFLSKMFLKMLFANPVVPQKDPRIAEALDIYVPPASAKLARAK